DHDVAQRKALPRLKWSSVVSARFVVLDSEPFPGDDSKRLSEPEVRRQFLVVTVEQLNDRLLAASGRPRVTQPADVFGVVRHERPDSRGVVGVERRDELVEPLN